MNHSHYNNNSHLHHDTNNSGIKISWIIGIAFSLILVGLFSLFFFFSGNSGEKTQKDFTSETIESSTSLSIIDCGENFDCLIEGAEDCNPSKLSTGEQSIELFGMIITASSTQEIRGEENGKCILSTTTDSHKVDIGPEMREELLDAGTTEEEIESIVEEANIAAASTIGSITLCRFNSGGDLALYLQNSLEGDLSFSFKGELTEEGFEGETTANGVSLDCDYIPSS